MHARNIWLSLSSQVTETSKRRQHALISQVEIQCIHYFLYMYPLTHILYVFSQRLIPAPRIAAKNGPTTL
jgi:hypothetical protein